MLTYIHYYAPVPIGEGIKRCFCLTSVCLSHTQGLSREQRGLDRLKLAQGQPTSHVTETPLSRSKGQGTQAALLTTALTHQAAAVVSMGTYWAWETTATLRRARRRQALRRPQREERGGGISRRPPGYSLFNKEHKRNKQQPGFRSCRPTNSVKATIIIRMTLNREYICQGSAIIFHSVKLIAT